MNLPQESIISCPYCAKVISILVDGSVEEQQYIEDCEVCCRPMDIRVNVSANSGTQVDVHTEND
ncbi:MAG: CPXCG motif-containing cysteine-rich protein [Xanthomonadales bacterium]|nr:CPXCG motif-containing cysteine-rich protein [Gammaproteobacteria bacterium]MBT8054883.1 CPXCG motif-containing cysteine-rich protein [Gammaproteobacteria bacterium]NND58186.1 CPXCG motif-containing cysteine-rich protein [Xanthomonadales bacterium]NNK50043.1 CPXCG motif-containing cysteine-rich protein [Xanthomonadales bacterium]